MKNVILCIPADSWETLRETLELDARSIAFDKELRLSISEALEQVSYITDDFEQLLDQYAISGYGVGEDIRNLEIVTGIVPDKQPDEGSGNRDRPWGDVQ
jgi:hypothetical protein